MIGIFDSGSGGLTVLKALREELPSADVVYFGDIKNAPYGDDKPQEEISLLTVNAMQLLQERGANKIVSACNSVSASLALSVFDAFGIEPNHIIEMVGPTVSYFKGSKAEVLLCATPATVRAGIYQNAFRMIHKQVTIVAVPELAGAIEFGKPQAEIEKIIANAFKEVPPFDVLVLGCTHYPLALESFKKTLPNKAFFDPAHVVAERAKKLFWPQEVGGGATTFLISKESEHFRALVERLFLGTTYRIEMVE